LADTGLLNGRRATTTWWLAGAFRRRFPHVVLTSDEIVVLGWPLATAGAAMAQIDMMLAIVAKFARPALADDCARYLLLDKRTSQAAFISITQLAAQDSRIARAESWIRAHIADDFTINDVASAVALTPRTFARRLEAVCGLSPVRFVQRIRIEIAKMLLETTRRSVEDIAQQVGYAEPSTLRRLLRRETQRPPLSFRTRGVPPGDGRLKRA
jgi:transcriptional regulator GlxA family with amidase domain